MTASGGCQLVASCMCMTTPAWPWAPPVGGLIHVWPSHHTHVCICVRLQYEGGPVVVGREDREEGGRCPQPWESSQGLPPN